jgi:hypothetical protein
MVHAVALASSSTSLGVLWAQLGTAVRPEIIDALDKSIRDDIQRTSHWLFLGVLVSAFAVAVGVLLEGPEILHELWPKIFVQFTWSSDQRLRAFERRIRKIAFIGWFLIGVGVVGEGVFEGLQNWAEGELQTFNDILLADAQRTAASATREAGTAAQSAERAQRAADTLEARLREQFGARHLTRQQSERIGQKLRVLKGVKVDVYVIDPGNPFTSSEDSTSLGRDIARALGRAQVDVELWKLTSCNPEVSVSGVIVVPRAGEDNKNASLIAEALRNDLGAGVSDQLPLCRMPGPLGQVSAFKRGNNATISIVIGRANHPLLR